jgi:hypothetical protein
MVVLGISVYIFFKPRWLDITITGIAVLVGVSIYALLVPAWRNATFVVSAIALGVGVLMVLGASIYVLLRLWRENLKKKVRGR